MRNIYKYIVYLFRYLKVSVFAFSANISLYIFLKPNLGISLSTLLSDLFGTLILYILLRLTRKPKVRNNVVGFSFQYLISGITILINLFTINLINIFYAKYLLEQSFFSELSENYISLITKFISSIIGLIFSSSMTMKIGFYFGNKK